MARLINRGGYRYNRSGGDEMTFITVFLIIATMFTTTIPYALTHSYDDCKDYVYNFMNETEDDNWHIVIGMTINGMDKGVLHSWVAYDYNGEMIWFEPQTGLQVSESDGYINISYDSFMLCCEEYNNFGVDLCECECMVVR